MPQSALPLHWKGKEQEHLYAKQESEKPEGLNLTAATENDSQKFIFQVFSFTKTII